MLSTRTLGQVICVPLIEHSHQSKTRVLALHECRACVDRIGLSGLGKKGLLVTAKTLSEESLPENRTAALDLMETVLAKMDGDVDKLANICGTAYLSDKGRAIVEERWKKHSGSHQSLAQMSFQRDERARRPSQIPSSRATGAARISRRVEMDRTSTEGLRDELPSLKLQLDHRKSTAVASRHTEFSAPAAKGPFAFSFDAPQASHHDIESLDTSDLRREPVSSVALGTSALSGVSSSAAQSNATGASTEGAAASLRARLLKIREKQKEASVAPGPVALTTSFEPELSPTDLTSPLAEPQSVPIATEAGGETEERGELSENSYVALHACIEELLHTKPPVPESHPCLRDCTAALKKYHAAISNQPAAAPDMNYTEFSDLRQNIMDKTVECIENLTR